MVAADRYILFMSLMCQMNQEASKLSVTDVSQAIAYLALKVLIRRLTKELQTCKNSIYKDLMQLSSLIFYPSKSTLSPSKKVMDQVINVHKSVMAMKETPPQLKNLKISFPELLN
jgi:hypothetical protein